MISDTLADAVVEIDRYLTDEVFAGTYQGDLRERIVALRNQMDALRSELDSLGLTFRHGYMLLDDGNTQIGIAVGPGVFNVKGWTPYANQFILERPDYDPHDSGDVVVGELEDVSDQIIIRDSDQQGRAWEVMRWPVEVAGTYMVTRSRDPLGQIGQVCVTLVKKREEATE